MDNFFSHGNRTVTLLGLRQVLLINRSAIGGPHRGVLMYEDGTEIDVGCDFAIALRGHLAQSN